LRSNTIGAAYTCAQRTHTPSSAWLRGDSLVTQKRSASCAESGTCYPEQQQAAELACGQARLGDGIPPAADSSAGARRARTSRCGSAAAAAARSTSATYSAGTCSADIRNPHQGCTVHLSHIQRQHLPRRLPEHSPGLHCLARGRSASPNGACPLTRASCLHARCACAGVRSRAAGLVWPFRKPITMRLAAPAAAPAPAPHAYQQAASGHGGPAASAGGRQRATAAGPAARPHLGVRIHVGHEHARHVHACAPAARSARRRRPPPPGAGQRPARRAQARHCRGRRDALPPCLTPRQGGPPLAGVRTPGSRGPQHG